jgi:beta-lactamase class A
MAAGANGRVGVAALVVESDEAAALNGTGHFPMQSVYKLPIAMALLQRVDRGELSLGRIVTIQPAEYAPSDKYSPIRERFPQGTSMTLREVLHYALVESDGTASDVLLKLAGGPRAVTAYVRTLGIRSLIVAYSETDTTWQTQYRNWCAPQAAVRLLAALETGKGISPHSRALILADLRESSTGANRVRRLLPAGTPVADKTGSSGTRHGVAAATNDIALITLPDGRHLAVAIFVADSRASSATRDDVIARLACAAWDHWARSR